MSELESFESFVEWFDVDDCVDFVKLNGCLGLLFHGSSRRIISFKLSEDEKLILFVDKKSETGKPMIKLEIENVKHVLKGQQASRFKNWNYGEYENRSLSLYCGEGSKTVENYWTGDTIDMICDSEKEMDILVNTILFLQSDRGATTHERNQILETNVRRKERLLKKVNKEHQICLTWDRISAITPEILPFLDIHDVVFGRNCTFVITQSGDVYSWGKENDPKLGHRRRIDEEQTSIEFPQKIIFDNDHPPAKIVQLCTGESHTLFLEESGVVWGVGSNQFGQLCLEIDTNNQDYYVFCPVKLPTKIRFCQISCTSTSSAGIEEGTGKVYVWGDNRNSLLGLGKKTDEIVLEPTSVFMRTLYGNTKSYVVKLCARNSPRYTALSRLGNVFQWGDGSNGEIGNGKIESVFEPSALRSAFLKKKAHDIECGADSVVCLTRRGKMYRWGSLNGGQLGRFHKFSENLSQSGSINRPTLKVDLMDCRCLSVSCGEKHMVVLVEYQKRRGRGEMIRRVDCWGSTRTGASTDDSFSPVEERKDVSFFRTGGKFMKQLKKECLGSSEGMSIVRVVAGGNMSGAILKFDSPPLGVMRQCMHCRYTFKVKKKRKKQMRRTQMLCSMCECVVCSECCSRETLVLKYGYEKNSKVCKKCFGGESFPGENDLKERVEFLRDQINEENTVSVLFEGVFVLRGCTKIDVKSLKSLFL